MSHQEPYPDGSEKGESAPSSSVESGVYQFPKSNVSEIEALMAEEGPVYEGWNWGFIMTLSACAAFWAIVIFVVIQLWPW